MRPPKLFGVMLKVVPPKIASKVLSYSQKEGPAVGRLVS